MNYLQRLCKWTEKDYEFNFQLWGEGKYSIYVEKNGVELFSTGQNKTANEAMRNVLDYLQRVNKGNKRQIRKTEKA